MQIKFIPPSSAHSPSLLRKAGAFVMLAVLAALVLMFSAVLLVFILLVAVFGGAYLWWKTRTARKLMREMQRFAQAAQARREAARGKADDGEVIEGVVVRAHEADVRIKS